VRRQSWGPLALAVLGAVGILGVGAAILFQRPAPRAPAPPPPKPLSRAAPALAPPATAAPASAAPSLAVGAASSPSSADAAPGPGGSSPDAGVGMDAGAESSALPDEQYLLFPLATNDPAAESAPGRASSTRRARPSRGQTELQKEWGRVRTDYTRLTRDIGCANLDFLCGRYENLEAEVARAGDTEDEALLLKVRQLLRDINKKKGGS
jgi:eukaryotic-like serine/threonine-protein kinase